MSKAILYSLENISSSMKSCRNIAIAPDFYNSIYTSDHLHRYSVIYRATPYYIYVIISNSKEAKRFVSLAERVATYELSPFQQFEYHPEELLTFDDNRQGRYYDIVLTQQCVDESILERCSMLKFDYNSAISLCNQTLWLIHNDTTITNFELSQIKISNNQAIFELSKQNNIESLRQSNNTDTIKKLFSTIIVTLYTIANNRWNINIQNILKDGWKRGFESDYDLSDTLDNNSLKELFSFIGSNCSLNEIADKLDTLANKTKDELLGIFRDTTDNYNFYDTTQYRVHPDLSREMCHVIIDKTTGKFGFISSSGKSITPIIYDSVTPFHESIAIVSKNRFYYAINRDGEKITQGRYKYIKWLERENIFIASENKEEYNILSRQGERITKQAYARIGEFHYNRAVIEDFNQKRGFIDPNGKEVLPPVYDDVLEFEEGIGYAKKGDQWYIVGYDGDIYMRER